MQLMIAAPSHLAPRSCARILLPVDPLLALRLDLDLDRGGPGVRGAAPIRRRAPVALAISAPTHLSPGLQGFIDRVILPALLTRLLRARSTAVDVDVTPADAPTA